MQAHRVGKQVCVMRLGLSADVKALDCLQSGCTLLTCLLATLR